MSEKYKFHDPEGIYFVTTTVVHWIDLFSRPEYKHVLINSLKYCQEKKGLIIHAYCIMPSHIHMIISTNKDPLSSIMRDFKKHTSRKIIKEIGRINESRKEWLLRGFSKAGDRLKRISKYKVWQDGNHPIELESNRFLEEKIDYIHNNPVEAEIVDEPAFYWYSSARDYEGVKKGLLDVVFIE
ncbi:transposase [Fulvivirgaceae bacterium BMA12]|uniref:Transposase n=2 Tax=Agaribacillus aureus TaxID=3051825 RepID=A0ABT8LI28_9BACT|nr:transposase [Fulvivirgaceae bacterium BMA12]